jgi:hypothetical protein
MEANTNWMRHVELQVDEDLEFNSDTNDCIVGSHSSTDTI